MMNDELPPLLWAVGISCLFGVVLGPVYWLLSKAVVGKRIEYVSGLFAAVVGLAISTALVVGLMMIIISTHINPTPIQPLVLVLPLLALSVTNFILIRTNDNQRLTFKQAFLLQAIPVACVFVFALFASRS